MKHILILLFAATMFFSCKTVDQTKNLQDCSYSFTKIDNFYANGVLLDDVKSFSDLSSQQTALLSQAIMSRKMPVSLIAYVQIKNPNKSIAALNRLDWKIEIRGKEIAEGSTIERFEIKPGETVTVPIEITADLAKIMNTFSIRELTDIVFNFSDKTGLPKEAQLKIRPSLRIGKTEIPVPAYFTVPIPVK